LKGFIVIEVEGLGRYRGLINGKKKVEKVDEILERNSITRIKKKN